MKQKGFFAKTYASVNSNCAHSPPGQTLGHYHFFLLNGKFPGVGTLQLPNAPRLGLRKRANAPPPGSYVPNQHCSSFHLLHNNATFSIFMCDFSFL